MPCASFEDRLIDYSELSAADRTAVDSHLKGCDDCREYFAVMEQLDSGMAGLYSGVQAAPGMPKAVLSRVAAETRFSKPSPLPEVLDFIGWTGILAALFWVARLLPDFPLEFPAGAVAVAAVAIASAVWAGIRSYADLKG